MATNINKDFGHATKTQGEMIYMKITLDKIADVSVGALTTRFSKRYEGPKEEKEVLYYKGKEIYTETEEIAADINDKYLSHKEDVLFRLSEPQFAVKVDGENIKEGVVISSKFAIIKTNEEINPDFLVALLNSQIVKNQLNKYSEGQVIKLVKVKDLVKIELTIPSLEEQKEYVETIELINKEIHLQKKLITENRNLKEAIIQKTQGGE